MCSVSITQHHCRWRKVAAWGDGPVQQLWLKESQEGTIPDCALPVLGSESHLRSVCSWDRVSVGMTMSACWLLGHGQLSGFMQAPGSQRSTNSNAPRHRSTSQPCLSEQQGWVRDCCRGVAKEDGWVGRGSDILSCCTRVPCPPWALPLFPRAPSSSLLSSCWTSLHRLQVFLVLRPDIPVGSCACRDSTLSAFYYSS